MYQFIKAGKPVSTGRFKILLWGLLLAVSQANAQNFFPQQTNYGIRIGAEYEIPRKNLKSDYRAGLNYTLGFIKYFDKLTFDISVGYCRFSARNPDITQTDSKTGVESNWLTSPYSTYSLYAGGLYNVQLSGKLQVYGGLNLGIYYSTFSLNYWDDDDHVLFTAYNQKQPYIGPRLGASFAINNNLDLDLHGSYNIFTAHYTRNINFATNAGGNIFTTLSAGAGVVMKF